MITVDPGTSPRLKTGEPGRVDSCTYRSHLQDFRPRIQTVEVCTVIARSLAAQAPLLPSTKHMINAEKLKIMWPGPEAECMGLVPTSGPAGSSPSWIRLVFE